MAAAPSATAAASAHSVEEYAPPSRQKDIAPKSTAAGTQDNEAHSNHSHNSEANNSHAGSANHRRNYFPNDNE